MESLPVTFLIDGILCQDSFIHMCILPGIHDIHSHIGTAGFAHQQWNESYDPIFPRPSTRNLNAGYVVKEVKLQKLCEEDDIEHYLTTFERIAEEWKNIHIY